MRQQIPFLNSLRALEAAGRCGSLIAAARELSVSPAAISRHVTLLEAHFARPLLIRSRTGVEPTAEATAYIRALGQAFDIIARSSDTLSKAAPGHQRLRLRLYTTFTTEWLAARLPRFRAERPDIDLEISLSTRDTDFRGGYDIVVTAVPPIGPEYHRDPLFETIVGLVAAPDVTVTTPQDLARHTLLFAPRELPLWDTVLDALGAAGLEHQRRIEFDTLSLTYQVARRGGGIALGHLFLIADDLRDGTLTLPLGLTSQFEVTNYLVCRTSRLTDPAVAAFRDWLLREARETVDFIAGYLPPQAT